MCLGVPPGDDAPPATATGWQRGGDSHGPGAGTGAGGRGTVAGIDRTGLASAAGPEGDSPLDRAPAFRHPCPCRPPTGFCYPCRFQGAPFGPPPLSRNPSLPCRKQTIRGPPSPTISAPFQRLTRPLPSPPPLLSLLPPAPSRRGVPNRRSPLPRLPGATGPTSSPDWAFSRTLFRSVLRLPRRRRRRPGNGPPPPHRSRSSDVRKGNAGLNVLNVFRRESHPLAISRHVTSGPIGALTISASRIVRSSTVAHPTVAHPTVQSPAAETTTAAATGDGTADSPRAADAAVTAGGAKALRRGKRGARPGIGPAPSGPPTPEPTNHAQTRSGRRGAAMQPLRPPGARSALPVGAKRMI